MPVFDTPAPITATLELGVGDARIIASDRTDTVVDVQPRDDTVDDDVWAAQHTHVEYSDGRLLVRTPKSRTAGWLVFGPFGTGGAVDVRIELPSGSHIHGSAATAALRGTGQLGDCRFKIGVGDIRLDHTAACRLITVGDIIVDRAAGDAEATTGSGAVRIGEVDGAAIVKSSNGDIQVRRVGGELHVKSANGDIVVGRAEGGVNAKTANGDIRVDEAVRGAVVLHTACGRLEVGIPKDTAAWLDLTTKFGEVRNDLETVDGPSQCPNTVEVTARTGYGDIRIRRSHPVPPHGSSNDT